MRKFFTWLVVLAVLGGGGWIAWKWYRATGVSSDALALIPNDAIYCVATSDPVKSWNQVARSAVWQHLQGNDYFAAITASANSLDSLIRDNEMLFSLIGSRSLIMSAHMIGTKDYDFLFLVDLQGVSGVRFINDYLSEFTAEGYTIRKEKYQEHDIVIVHDRIANTNLYLSVPGSFLVASYTRKVLQSALDASASNQTLSSNAFSQASPVSGDVQFYLNYTMLPRLMRVYSDGTNEYVNKLSQSLVTTSLSLSVENDLLKADGVTIVNDSVESYLKTLLLSGKGGSEFLEIAPQRTGFCVGLGFSSFGTFFENFEKNIQQDVTEYAAYRESLEQVENYLRISVRQNIISWIGDEIAMLELQSSGAGLDTEVALILKAGNIEMARKELTYIEEQVRKRTPVKFKAVDHEGYSIRYLGMKGLFKVILGKFFARYDKPYYTIINNFVVFSNHPQTLKSMIDDYLARTTLDRSAEFREFRRHLDDESAALVYVNMPVLFNTMKGMADAATRASMDKNKPYIVSFRHIAFQLVPQDGRFRTLFVQKFVPVDAAQEAVIDDSRADSLAIDEGDDELTDVPVDAGRPDNDDDPMKLPYIYVRDLNAKRYTGYFPDSLVQFEVEIRNGFKDGSFTEYYPSGREKMTGKFRSDKRDGVWRLYGEDGKLLMRRRYDNGEIRAEKIRD